MKITINDSVVVPVLPFPKLMVAENGQVVYFLKDSCGVSFNNPSTDGGAPKYLDRWSMDNFTDFHGTITLEQL